MLNIAKNYLVENGFEIVSESDGFVSFVANRDNEYWFIHVAGRKSDFGKKRFLFESIAGSWLAENTAARDFSVKFAALVVRKHDFDFIVLDEGNAANKKTPSIKDKILHANAIEASMKFFLRKDYEIITQTPKLDGIDLVCLDENILVFVTVRVDKDGMPEDVTDRATLENSAAIWLASEDAAEFGDCPIRFDTIGMLVIGGDRALLRHHINALG